MTALTSDSFKRILGDIDGNTLAAIQATGASLKDVTEAKAIVDAKSDIVGQGEQAISGPVKQVVMILSGVSE